MWQKQDKIADCLHQIAKNNIIYCSVLGVLIALPANRLK